MELISLRTPLALFLISLGAIAAVWWWLATPIHLVRAPIDPNAKLQCVSYAPFRGQQSPLDFPSGDILGVENPALGVASDLLIAAGGTVILSETPELIGAEHIIAKRARTEYVGTQVVEATAWWEKEAIAAGQDIREANPSPGNIAGGITTLEEKSLGCIYKAGTAPLEEVIPYGFSPTKKGLVFMDTPAHDIEQLTGMVAGGAQIVAFTTGRGTPIGSPIAPVIKITANGELYRNMRDAIDVDVSRVLKGHIALARVRFPSGVRATKKRPRRR